MRAPRGRRAPPTASPTLLATLTAAPRGAVYLGSPAYDDVLRAELSSLSRAPHAADDVPGAVLVPAGAGGLVDPCFARQVLVEARAFTGKTANELAGAIADFAEGEGASLDAAAAFAFPPEVERKGSGRLEEHPLTAAAVEVERVLRAKIAGRREKRGADATPISAHRLRVLVVDAWAAIASIDLLPVGPALLSWPARFPSGRAVDEGQSNAPSSAHRKLEEALAWLEARPGPDDRVLDLGAAPGGWSWVALAHGARVDAVDRGALDPHVAGHARLVHHKKDAYTFVPDVPPSWLLCDVIGDPTRTLELARAAADKKTLQALVVTLKLKRPVDLELLKRARAVARTTQGFFGRCKHLGANKLEVTLMMHRH